MLCVDLSGPDQPGLLATGGSDFKVRVFSIKENRLLAELEGHERAIASIKFCPDSTRDGSRFVLSGSYDRTARVWDWTQGKKFFF